MKIKFSLVFLIFFIFFGSIFDVHAGKWKDKWDRVNFTTVVNTSLTTTCPAGQVLIDSQKYKSWFWTSGTLTCIELDLSSPTINVLGNWYSDGSWTNRNVTLSVSVSDVWTGLKSVWYKVNTDPQQIWSASFDLAFNEEGTYTVTIGAEDLSTHNSEDWSATSIWNKYETVFTIKIDKSPMVLTTTPDTNYNWRTTNPTIAFKLEDKYKWQSIEIRTFTCSWKPESSVWISPVASDGNLVWTCNPALWSCIADSNYSPNTTSCNWKCIDGYTKGSDNLCHQNSVSLTCDNSLLPQWTSIYNINNVLVNETTNILSYWIAPVWVSSDGSFVSNYTLATNTYTPETSSCWYDCRSWYHLDNSKCVNDVSVICCRKDYPLTEPVTVWAVIDCSLAINANHVACMYNNLCSDFTKDVLKYWTGTEYDYESEWVSGIDTLVQACWMVNIPNSDGETCNPWYYLVWGGTANQNCERVPTWEWSWQENIKKSCTNKPSNSTYTSHTATTWGSNDCPWACDGDYTKSGNTCSRQSKSSSCNSKPSNTSWNSVSSITQYKNSGNWEPSLTPTYNTTASTSECRFKCSTWYGWDGDSCELTVNGSCGSSNGWNFPSIPSTNLCNSWTASSVSWTGPWSWTCNWLYWWSNASCSANMTNVCTLDATLDCVLE